MTLRSEIFGLIGIALLLVACSDDSSSESEREPEHGASSDPGEAVRTTLPPFRLPEPAPFYRLDLRA